MKDMISEQIRNDMVAAMKAKDALRVEVLRAAMTAFTNELVAKGKKPTDTLEDADSIAVFKRMAKQRKDASEQFTKGDRAELAQKEMEELKMIEEYLPQMASREEIESAAKKVIADTGADKSKMGIAIGAVMKELGGNADGSEVKDVVAKLLE